MDNASKAIVMAGGVLIAIALISVAVYAFNSARNFASSADDILSASQIQSFNRFYQEYRTGAGTTSTIDCIDAVNILNRAVEDDIEADVTSNLITANNLNGTTVYTADSKNYTTKTLSYSLSYDPVGRVSKVTISN